METHINYGLEPSHALRREILDTEGDTRYDQHRPRTPHAAMPNPARPLVGIPHQRRSQTPMPAMLEAIHLRR
jgi:hypothetical protein